MLRVTKFQIFKNLTFRRFWFLCSIGRLGNDDSTVIVSKIVVDTSFLKGTTNGLRVKICQVILFFDTSYTLYL